MVLISSGKAAIYVRRRQVAAENGKQSQPSQGRGTNQGTARLSKVLKCAAIQVLGCKRARNNADKVSPVLLHAQRLHRVGLLHFSP